MRAVNSSVPTWDLLGFVDDDPDRHGTIVSGLPVLGPIETVHDRPDVLLAICTGRPDNYVSRRLIAGRLAVGDERYATIIHPTATISTTSRVGPGSVLLAHVDLTANVVIGRHVAVMPQVVLTHDCRVEDWATLAAGVRVGGSCQIAEEAYVGSGVCLREGTKVGQRALVGMASVVLTDVPEERLWFGAPARDMGRAPVPDPKPGR